MAKASRELTVAELEKLLENKRSLLDVSLKKRDKLENDLAAVEKRIQTLQGRPHAAGKGGRKPKRRPQNKMPLPAVVAEILGKSRKGLSLSELAEKVLAAGHKSGSKHFKTVLYQCLYNSDKFVHDKEARTYSVTK